MYRDSAHWVTCSTTPWQVMFFGKRKKKFRFGMFIITVALPHATTRRRSHLRTNYTSPHGHVTFPTANISWLLENIFELVRTIIFIFIMWFFLKRTNKGARKGFFSMIPSQSPFVFLKFDGVMIQRTEKKLFPQ